MPFLERSSTLVPVNTLSLEKRNRLCPPSIPRVQRAALDRRESAHRLSSANSATDRYHSDPQ
jgi:hypothetical protein